MGKWGPHVLDTLISPGLSKLNECRAQPVPELPSYGGSLRLNHLFAGIQYPEDVRILLLNFIGRLSTAISEYNHGQQKLQSYVDALASEQQLGEHHKALAHFENTVLQLHVAIVCLRGVGKGLDLETEMRSVFENEGSEYDRLRKLNNRIKHFDEDVATAVRRNQSVPIAPIWITNEGLAATSAELRFIEMEAIMRDQTRDAEFFGEKLAKQVAERRAAQTPPENS